MDLVRCGKERNNEGSTLIITHHLSLSPLALARVSWFVSSLHTSALLCFLSQVQETTTTTKKKGSQQKRRGRKPLAAFPQPTQAHARTHARGFFFFVALQHATKQSWALPALSSCSAPTAATSIRKNTCRARGCPFGSRTRSVQCLSPISSRIGYRWQRGRDRRPGSHSDRARGPASAATEASSRIRHTTIGLGRRGTARSAAPCSQPQKGPPLRPGWSQASARLDHM